MGISTLDEHNRRAGIVSQEAPPSDPGAPEPEAEPIEPEPAQPEKEPEDEPVEADAAPPQRRPPRRAPPPRIAPKPANKRIVPKHKPKPPARRGR